MSSPELRGGTAADRARILQLHADYLDVNSRFDWEGVEPLFSGAADAEYFNLNGHTYHGRAHWIRLWQFYGQNVQSSYWTPYDIHGIVDGTIAIVWCHRKTRRRWTGSEPPPRDLHYDESEFVTRSTMAFEKQADGEWRIVHAHFSKEEATPRPGGV